MGTFDFLLHPGGRLPFQNLHGVGDGISRGEEEKAVDMVVLNGKFDDFPVFPFADGFEYPSELAFDLVRGEYLSTVLRCPDEMAFEVVETM